MKEKSKYLWILVLLIPVFGMLYNINQKVNVNRFYNKLESALSVKIKEMEHNFENNNLVEVKLISRGPLYETSWMVDPGETFYSEYWKDTIVNYGATYKEGFEYESTAYLKNNSSYDLYTGELSYGYLQNTNSNITDYLETVKSGESLNITCVFRTPDGDDRYRDDGIILDESIYINDIVKFNYKNRNIEIPVQIRIGLCAYENENTIQKVDVDVYDIEASIDSSNEELNQEVKNIIGKYRNIDDFIVSVSVDDF